jgi:hypothetical protein
MKRGDANEIRRLAAQYWMTNSVGVFSAENITVRLSLVQVFLGSLEVVLYELDLLNKLPSNMSMANFSY